MGLRGGVEPRTAANYTLADAKMTSHAFSLRPPLGAAQDFREGCFCFWSWQEKNPIFPTGRTGLFVSS